MCARSEAMCVRLVVPLCIFLRYSLLFCAVPWSAAFIGPHVVIPLPLGRVLVVDDNEDLAQLFSVLISSLGYDVETVYSATDALEKISTYSPHLVFSDIGMPGLSGHDLAQLIRSGTWTQPFLVAVSGWNDARTVDKSLEVGFDVHLVKPVSYDQVFTLLKDHFKTIDTCE